MNKAEKMLSNPTSPKEWESYFKSLLRLHYGPENLYDMPDSHGGDGGIECFTQCGLVFQCYFPEQTSDKSKLRTDTQNKINEDLNKLREDKKKKLSKAFGAIKIRRWVLAVPEFRSSELQGYCSKKTEEVTNEDLPFIASEFRVMIQTAADYPVEQAILAKKSHEFSLSVNDEEIPDISEFIENQYEFLKNLDRKLATLGQPSRKDFLVHRFLEFQNYSDNLLKNYSEIWEDLNSAISNREKYLETRFLTDPSAKPASIMASQLQELQTDIKNMIPTISKSNLELISLGVLSDWLIRCPLDFSDEP